MDGWPTPSAVSPARLAAPDDAPEAPLRAKGDEQGLARGLLVACLAALLLGSALNGGRLLACATAGLEWLRGLGPRLTPLVLLGLQVGAMLLVMPTWPLWLCGGAACTLLWGQALGLAVAFCALGCGVWLGSVLAFLLGRYALRPCIARWASRRPLLRAIDLAVERRGLALCLLLKLSPLMHTSLSNYLLAATRVRLLHFALGCAGSFLPMAVWVLAGASLASLSAPLGEQPLQAALSPRMRAAMVSRAAPLRTAARAARLAGRLFCAG